MSAATPSFFRWCARLLPLGAILAATAVTSGQNGAPTGAPDDWTHHHVVFSNPGTAAQAIQRGDYARWAAVVSDPRFLLQQRKREAAARGGLNTPLPPPQAENEAGPPETESPGDDRQSENPSRRGVNPAFPHGGQPEPPHPPGLHHRHRHHGGSSNLHTDWSVNLGSGASLGLGVYPAKYSFSLSSATCATDFVVYNTGLAGTGMMGSTQASIVAFNNLYTGCGTVPSFYWAYDTAGGKIVTSVTLSLDGSQVAFVQTTGTAASLVVLKWAASASETPSAPDVLTSTAASSYRACTAPCMTVIPFSGSANDSGSSVYPDYGADTIYVGDDAGNLHKFTGVFAGSPTEAGTPWPVSVSAGGEALSSPVYDPVSGHVLVGDYLSSEEANCATGGCGYLYTVSSSTGAVVQSARLDYIFGVVDAPLLDISAQTAYVFVGADSGFESSSSPCGSRVPCSGVFQFPTTFSSGAAGTEAKIGNGYQILLTGTPDNQFFTSANPASPTGNLYVVGNTGAANNTLYQIPITANVMGAPNSGPVLSTNYTDGFMMAAGMGLTEIFNGTDDYIFTSVLIYAAPSACITSSLTEGCVMGFNVTSGTISSSTMPTGATMEAGGVSAIIVDNTVTSGAITGSNIYYTPLANQMCTTSGTTGGCAIQISQASP